MGQPRRKELSGGIRGTARERLRPLRRTLPDKETEIMVIVPSLADQGKKGKGGRRSFPLFPPFPSSLTRMQTRPGSGGGFRPSTVCTPPGEVAMSIRLGALNCHWSRLMAFTLIGSDRLPRAARKATRRCPEGRIRNPNRERRSWAMRTPWAWTSCLLVVIALPRFLVGSCLQKLTDAAWRCQPLGRVSSWCAGANAGAPGERGLCEATLCHLGEEPGGEQDHSAKHRPMIQCMYPCSAIGQKALEMNSFIVQQACET